MCAHLFQPVQGRFMSASRVHRQPWGCPAQQQLRGASGRALLWLRHARCDSADVTLLLHQTGHSSAAGLSCMLCCVTSRWCATKGWEAEPCQEQGWSWVGVLHAPSVLGSEGFVGLSPWHARTSCHPARHTTRVVLEGGGSWLQDGLSGYDDLTIPACSVRLMPHCCLVSHPVPCWSNLGLASCLSANSQHSLLHAPVLACGSDSLLASAPCAQTWLA